MALYVSYVVGSSLAVYLGNRIYRGAMVSDIDVNETDKKGESAKNKYIVKDEGDEVEILKQEEEVKDEVKDEPKDEPKEVKKVTFIEKPMGKMTEDGEKLYRCSKCDGMLKEKLFSKTQRKKALVLWKCKICTKLH